MNGEFLLSNKSCGNRDRGLGCIPSLFSEFPLSHPLTNFPSKRKRWSLQMSQVALQSRAYSGFCSMKWLGVFLYSLLDGMLVHCRATPSIELAGSHLYTWAERDTVRVKCLAQERHMMFPARAWTQTAQSGGEPSSHKATVPLQARECPSFTVSFLQYLHKFWAPWLSVAMSHGLYPDPNVVREKHFSLSSLHSASKKLLLQCKWLLA